MSPPAHTQKQRRKSFGFILFCCFVLLLALFGLWIFGLIGLWGAYVLIPLGPVVYLFVVRWGYEHNNDKPVANQKKQSPASAIERKNAKTKARYNRIAWMYDLMEAPIEWLFFRRWRTWLFLEVSQGRLLEIGVGTGKNLPYYPANVQVTAIDISDKMLAKARKKPQSERIDIQLMDVQHLEFPDESFDTVIATFVFCSVSDAIQGLREIRRVLKPDGKLVLLENVRPENRWLGTLFDLFNPVVVRLGGANINRQTAKNIERAGLRLKFQYRRFGIFRLMVAQPLTIDNYQVSSSNSTGGINDERN